MPRSSIIGYSGFVGSNLASRFAFSHRFRSTDIDQIRGKEYDLLVCAGVPAVKWKANKNPAEDLAGIDQLLSNLAEVKAARMVLISTVDVYPLTTGVDEAFDCAELPNHAYGANRLHLELALRDLNPGLQVVRLPGLFGPGLKKNVIYDLLNDNCLDAIRPGDVFQYYDVTRLWDDLQVILAHDLPLVNLVTEPVGTETILETYFPDKKVGAPDAASIRYDIRTRHAPLFGGKDGYRFSKQEVLDHLGQYIQSVKRGIFT